MFKGIFGLVYIMNFLLSVIPLGLHSESTFSIAHNLNKIFLIFWGAVLSIHHLNISVVWTIFGGKEGKSKGKFVDRYFFKFLKFQCIVIRIAIFLGAKNNILLFSNNTFFKLFTSESYT
jgi:hypothetical protein